MSKAWEHGSDTRWRTFRAGIIERDKGVCTLRSSRCTGLAEQVHHIHPLSKGGARYDPLNCTAACKACNLLLGDREPASQPAPRPRSSW